MPFPVLANAPAPEITPVKVLLALLAPAVNVPLPIITLPAPVKLLIVALAPVARLKVAQLAIEAELLLLQVFPTNLKVPALTVKAAVDELIPSKVKMPLPCLVNPPVPESKPV